MDLEIINRLYLELSQVATAKTAKEIALEDKLELCRVFVAEFRGRSYIDESLKRQADALFHSVFDTCASCSGTMTHHQPYCGYVMLKDALNS